MDYGPIPIPFCVWSCTARCPVSFGDGGVEVIQMALHMERFQKTPNRVEEEDFPECFTH